MKKPIIGIIAREYKICQKNLNGVYDNYIKKIDNNDGISLIIPIISNDIERLIDLCDGIIIPGGSNETENDFKTINYVIKKNIPVLGICLGMQVMGLNEESELIKVKNHCKRKHYVYFKDNSLLKKIYKKEKIEVNSRHKFKIYNLNNYIVEAISSDCVIEGINMKKQKFHLGVQWHPEDLEDDALFKYFINICSK